MFWFGIENWCEGWCYEIRSILVTEIQNY